MNTHPLLAVRNLAAKALRRAALVPKRFVRLGRRSERAREQAGVFRAEWRIERDIAALVKGRQPIIAGPWLSEVGFEVLYWIPFLRWIEDRYRVGPERVIAVSRGGAADWYRSVAGRYIEIFDHVDTAEFARRNAERREAGESGGQKQTSIGAFDHELAAVARRVADAPRATVCHPSLMYRLFGRFWLGSRALDLVLRRTLFEPLTVPQRDDLDLPERFIAAKFYTGTALPDTPECRHALREVVRAAAATLPVVMLDTGLGTDEHRDYLFADIPNVVSLRDRLDPRTNLGTQTAVVSASEGFIGTCGSLAWLAPMMGVDTVAVFADDRFLISHLYFARQVYRQIGAARFDTLDLRAAAQLNLLQPVANVEQ